MALSLLDLYLLDSGNCSLCADPLSWHKVKAVGGGRDRVAMVQCELCDDIGGPCKGKGVLSEALLGGSIRETG
jgi:hypothetical protein